MPNRRQFLGAAALTAAGAYINHRGLRYPRLHFESSPILFERHSPATSLSLQHAIFTSTDAGEAIRAISPEPTLAIEKRDPSPTVFEIKNLSTRAILKPNGDPLIDVDEIIEGTTRKARLSGAGAITLNWLMPNQLGLRFAVIGDTGAGLELEWVLQRAHVLGAEFLLHLGDFNYVEGEYERAIRLFNEAPLPCFISIGNHDFNDHGLVYDQFLTNLGPLNHQFSFAGTQFINIDTAADFFPAYSGQRGRFLDLIEHHQGRHSNHYSDTLCFTHRNFLDPRPGQDHIIGGVGERRWLADKLTACGAQNVLTGHVHHSAEMEYRKINQYTVGEGLGFEDIVHEKQVAQLLLGHVELGKRVRYQWAPLELPWAFHTSPEHEEKLRLEHPASKLVWYKKKLAASQGNIERL